MHDKKDLTTGVETDNTRNFLEDADSHLSPSQSSSNLPDIQRTLKLLFNPGDVVELRVLHTSNGTVSGYFNDMDKMANAAMEWSGQAPGVYGTINPVFPDLLARSNNQTKEWAKNTTSDTQVMKRQWLPLDFDPIRPSGISSTDVEHDQALLTAIDCVKFLEEQLGFSEDSIILADSGNGAHVLVRIELHNDEKSTKLVKGCLEAVAFRFSDDKVSVDLGVSNAGRIWKLYGTMACKGDSTKERPHRLSKLLVVPPEITPAPSELLKKLAAMAPEQPKPDANRVGQHTSFDLARWVETNQLDVSGPFAWNNGGQKWIFRTCPLNPDHRDRAAYIVQFANGAIGAGCHHNGCAGKGWHELRDVVEPDWRKEAANQDQNLTSDYTDGASEVRWNREVNAGELQRSAKESPESFLNYLSLLGQPGLIVKGWSHLLAGYPRAGKTDLIVRILPEWREDRVLYFTEESESLWKARLKALPTRYDHVTIVCALGMTTKEIIKRIQEGQETVVIIDAVRNLLHPQDEKDNSEIARCLNPAILAARITQKTFLAVHHSRKGGGENGEAIAGGHAFLGVVDIALEIRREGLDDSRRRTIRGWGRVIQIPKLLYEMKPDGTMVALGSPGQVSLAEVTDRAYELLNEEWQDTKEIWEAFGEAKPSRDQVTKALEGLAGDGRAERDPPISTGKRPGKTYKWRWVSNLTSDEPFHRSEVKSQSEEISLQ